MYGERPAEALRRLLSPAMWASTERAGGGAEPVVNAEQTKERASEGEREKSPSRASEFVRRDKKLLTQVDLKLGPDSESGRGRFSMMKQKRSNILYSQRLHCNSCQVKQ